MKNIWKKLSVQFLRYAIELLHVKRRTRHKWRPIVTTFGTLIENMSRTGLYDCHIFQIFVDDFMSNINCGIGIWHVKRIWRICCDVIYLFAQVFIVSVDRAYKEVSTKKNIENCLWLSFCDMTVPSKSNVPSLWHWPLTYERQYLFSELIATILVSCMNFRSISLLIAEK